MGDSPGVPAPVNLSVRAYTRLLAAYPRPFRAEYGDLMAQHFRDICRRDYARRGFLGMTWVWARTSLDLLRTAVEEHIDRGLDMNRQKFVRWSGWALMAGAVLFAAGWGIGSLDANWDDPIGGVDAFYEIGQIVGLIFGQTFFVIGLMGLRTGFAQRGGGLSSFALTLALIGSLISLAGMLVMSAVEAGWVAWLLGLLTLALGLAAFGVAALQRRVFSRWNFAPLLAGSVLPTLAVVGLALGWFDGSSGPAWAFPAAVSTMAIGLILVGYRMQADGQRSESSA